MRHSFLIFVFLYAFSTFFIACNKKTKDDDFNLTKGQSFKIIYGACGSIVYAEKIGSDIESALDYVIKLREPMVIAEPWVKEYYIEKKLMTIDFNYDDREFYSIGFIDKDKNFHIFSLTDVIDSDGNYFYIHWCPD